MKNLKSLFALMITFVLRFSVSVSTFAEASIDSLRLTAPAITWDYVNYTVTMDGEARIINYYAASGDVVVTEIFFLDAIAQLQNRPISRAVSTGTINENADIGVIVKCY